MALPPSLTEKKSTSRRRKLFLTFFKVAFSLAIAALINQINLDFIESYLYDLRIRFQPSPPISKKIELIFITPETMQQLKGSPTAQDQENLLKHLLSESPKVIAYDYDLETVAGNLAEKTAWMNQLKQFTHFYASSKDLAMKGQEIKLTPPLEQIPLLAAPRTTDTLNFAKDGVTRRMMLTYQGNKSLPPTIAALENKEIENIHQIRGAFEFLETDQAYIQFRPAGTYPHLEFTQVLKGQFEPGRFRDKIILIGQDLGVAPEEYLATPYSREATAMTRLEMQANIIDTLIANSAPIRASPWFNLILIVMTSMLTVHVVLTMRPVYGLIVLACSFFIVSLTGYLIFWLLDYWVSLAHPLLAIFLCYYFFIPYRLIIENRRSWEYYQKNRLLSQVEELKGNFISMMSHDLKTPIARIQGMTDVILTDEVTLSSQQREAVDTIRHSASDLLKFISAILNYGRIESEGVQLQLQSKDVNTLIEEVIVKNEFLARVKKIQIISELEPLFPISIDPNLIRQVFSNLIENAIKYSPDETKIMITSEEKEGKVIVQVADQGYGIPQDELSSIFMKFFRSKNARSSPIKGSGLGLYLAKYFIELHEGGLFVESSHGQGSTFTVELPFKQRRSHA